MRTKTKIFCSINFLVKKTYKKDIQRNKQCIFLYNPFSLNSSRAKFFHEPNKLISKFQTKIKNHVLMYNHF